MYKSAYILSHNGLGDNITMIGAINYLSMYYENVYILCKLKYLDNIDKLINNKQVKTIYFNQNDEFNECKKIINNSLKDENADIFICGCHKNYLVSRINNLNIKNYKKTNKYTIKWSHIKNFYNDMNLDLTIYYEYFDIKSSDESIYFYNKVKHLNIIFCHTQSSTKTIRLPENITTYINDNKYIIVCANENVYNKNHAYFGVANIFVNIPIQNYIDVIKNACEIFVIDSCFSCIVHPLSVSNKLNTTKIEYYIR